MTLCKVLALAAGLPALAAAADPEMMNLVMPDATVVMEVNLAKIVASPIGASLGEAIHQGMAQRLKVELVKAKPQFQEQIAGLSEIDWSSEVKDVVVAGGPGKSPSMLMIVRSSLDAARIQSLKAFTGETTEFEGVTMLTSSKPGNGVIAFLDHSIVLIGQPADVKAAIHRRGEHGALPAALAAQVSKYRQYDIWLASTGHLPIPSTGPSEGPAANVKAAQYLKELVGFNGGLRFSPDFDLAADLETRTEKGTSQMADGLRWLTGMVQAKNGGKGTSGLEGLKYQATGKHVLLSLHVPAEQVRAGLQQMRMAQAHQMESPTPAAAPRQVVVAAPSSGLPPPPPGTIRVQSAEMGTRIIQVAK